MPADKAVIVSPELACCMQCSTDTVHTVVRSVFKVAERERPCREAVLLLIRFACNDRALEVGVLFDVDVEAAFSSEDTRLASGASIVGVDAFF